MRRHLVAVGLVAAVGCGRFGFGDADGRGADDERFLPSNGAVFPPGVALAPLVLAVDAVLSTDDGSIVDGITGQVLRPGGDGLRAGVWFEGRSDAAVFAMQALDVRRVLELRGARVA